MKIIVLYDGNCQLCQNSMKALKLIDWLHKLEPKDFRDEQIRERYAHGIQFSALDAEMHIKVGQRVEKGFYAFRFLCWHIPLLLPLAPFLYLPGVSFIGKRVYKRIAEDRMRCSGNACKHRRN